MGAKRALLMHISKISGHRCASLAIEKALRQIDKEVQVTSINAFGYTSPYWERLINKLYMFVIKDIPQFWDYLYDNQDVLERLRKTRSLIHKLKNKKIKKLFDEFNPDVVVCTQAFPCGMVADYKRRNNLNIPLIGVLTDYAPHAYWLDELVDAYIVPSKGIKDKFIQRGIPQERLEVLGVPIDTKFSGQDSRQEILHRLGFNAKVPVVLIMGGGQGLGPIKEIAAVLDNLKMSLQLIIVCGTNKKLYKWLNKKKASFSKAVSIVGYTDQIYDLMDISSFVVTKPGGLTSAEALSRSLPLIIVNPLPGQESLNAQFLLEAGVALRVDNLSELGSLTEQLLGDGAKLNELRKRAAAFARPDSAVEIARLISYMIRKNTFC